MGISERQFKTIISGDIIRHGAIYKPITIG